MEKYKKLKQIGEGSFGKAVLVEKVGTTEKFVIKVSFDFFFGELRC